MAAASTPRVMVKKADNGSRRTVQAKSGFPNGRLMAIGPVAKMAAADPARIRTDPASAEPQVMRRAAAALRYIARLTAAPTSHAAMPLRNRPAITEQTPHVPIRPAFELRPPGWN